MKKEIKKGEQWRKAYQTGFDEAMKACGGCTKCYGKGYSTVIEHISSGMGDFEGDPNNEVFERLPLMRYCSCERGQSLKRLLHK